MGMPKAFTSSIKQDYATPWPFVEALENELGRRFALDVCATEKSAKAPRFYTKEDNGLTKDWACDCDSDQLVWCNPEYGDGKIKNWLCQAAIQKEDNRLTTVFLLPANKTDQPWWHDIVIPSHSVWDVRGRVDFLDPETGLVPRVWQSHSGKWVNQSNPQASKIVIVGPGFGPGPLKSFSWR